MKKILILGAGGMAGHVIAEYLAQNPRFEIIRCARSAITPDTILLEDVTQFQKLEEILRNRQPDVVVNCVGLLVQASKDRIGQAILINSYLPHLLSGMGRKYGFKLIHISTDCVFSGKCGNYAEDDFRDGDTPYARTKALGEVINDVDLTLRTSLIGPELKRNGTGLLHWFLMQRGKIKGYTNVYWSGVTTLEFAKVIDHCINHELTGLINITMSHKVSKYDLLIECQKVWDHKLVQILPDEGHPCDKSMVSCRSDLSYKLSKSYTAMIYDIFNFMKDHNEWYLHYSL